MRVNRRSRNSSSFVLEWDDVERLIAALQGNFPKLEVETYTRDGLNRTFANANELKCFRNSEKAAITDLTLACRTQDFAGKVSVTFNNESSQNIKFSIDAEEAPAILANDFIEDFIASVRPWYSWVARPRYALIFLAFYLALFLLFLGLYAKDGKSINIEWPKDGISASAVLVFIFNSVCVGVAFNLFDAMRRRYFPIGTFAFGDGLKRHQRVEVIRTVVIAGTAIAIVTGVLFLFIGS